MTHGSDVAAFEHAMAAYTGARHAIACANGTVTLQAALSALGVRPGDRVAVPPLTMSATTIAVLNVGAVPVFVDVDPATWLMADDASPLRNWVMGVSLYGLSAPAPPWEVDDAAQALRPHRGRGFTSLSHQASKILPLGEGGTLMTDEPDLASRARSYLSLGYRMEPDQARIDSYAIRSPDYARHHLAMSINGRMNDLTAREGLRLLDFADGLLSLRREAADWYRQAIAGCAWLTPQHVPEGWRHDYWTYAVACDTPERARWLQEAVVRHGGERPYGAWRLTYQEPAFKHLMPGLCGTPKAGNAGCPVAESLQPRLLQFQTNDLRSAERNADALRRAIEEVEG